MSDRHEEAWTVRRIQRKHVDVVRRGRVGIRELRLPQELLPEDLTVGDRLRLEASREEGRAEWTLERRKGPNREEGEADVIQFPGTGDEPE